jgi:hypothetical protein
MSLLERMKTLVFGRDPAPPSFDHTSRFDRLTGDYCHQSMDDGRSTSAHDPILDHLDAMPLPKRPIVEISADADPVLAQADRPKLN